MFLGLRWDHFQAARTRISGARPPSGPFCLTPRERSPRSIRRSINAPTGAAFPRHRLWRHAVGPALRPRGRCDRRQARREGAARSAPARAASRPTSPTSTENAYTVDIKPLADRTRGVYDKLIEKGYAEFHRESTTKQAERLLGWGRACRSTRSSDCGIDHVPPPLLARQLQGQRPGGARWVAGRAARVLRSPSRGRDGSITDDPRGIYGIAGSSQRVPFAELGAADRRHRGINAGSNGRSVAVDLDHRPPMAFYLSVGGRAGVVVAAVGIVRVSAVGSWAPFGSLVVSLAMFGFGLPAVSCVGKGWFERHWQGAVRSRCVEWWCATSPLSRCRSTPSS